jgi:hypothetical protein
MRLPRQQARGQVCRAVRGGQEQCAGIGAASEGTTFVRALSLCLIYPAAPDLAEAARLVFLFLGWAILIELGQPITVKQINNGPICSRAGLVESLPGMTTQELRKPFIDYLRR